MGFASDCGGFPSHPALSPIDGGRDESITGFAYRSFQPPQNGFGFRHGSGWSILRHSGVGGVQRDGWNGHAAQMPRRHQGRRFHPVRGRPILHRGARLARRRGGEDRKPEERRSRPPPAARPARTTTPYYFHMFNANKKSITVNLKDPRGLSLVKDLLRKADVCVENMAPGTIERLGLGYDVVRAINPGIIYCQVKGFGTGSPYEKNLAFDMIAQATGGTISVTGEKDGRPVKPGLSLGDTGTGMTMAITHPRRAVQAGEDRRGPSAAGGDAGRDAALHAHQLLHPGAQRQGGGAAAAALGRRQQRAVRHLFPARRAARTTTSRSDQPRQPGALARLCKVMGREELIDDPRFATPADRVQARGRARCDHRDVDPIAHASTRRWRRSAAPASRRARCSTRWSCTTSRASSSAASCR